MLVTWHQKNTADRRGEWWRRTTWAFERSISVNLTEAKLGWTLLRTMVKSKLVMANDLDVAQVVAEHVALGQFDGKGGRHRAE